jgi:quercetin dioxygenase-like cupin family protein
MKLQTQEDRMRSKIHRFSGNENEYDWEGTVPIQFLPDSSEKYAAGKIVIGPQDEAPNFVFRYFSIEPGRHSHMPDIHLHDHGVYFLHGKGEVMLDGENYPVQAHDMVYIASNEPHGIINTGDEPLGFLCVIPNKERLKDYLKLSGKEG